MSFTGFQLGLTDSLIEASRKVAESSAEYKKFFDGALKKFGVTSPSELDDAKKKEFFDYIDKNWNGESESGKDGAKEEVKEGELPPALQKAIDKKKGKEDDKEVDEGATPSKKFIKIK
tara:strand:+ start:92 stop:445 length:354 start_codon:yes stop_codon:yes gene_type:complete